MAGTPAPRRLRSAPARPGPGGWKVVAPPDIPVPAIERRKSSLHGWGVFALEPIAKNRRIVAYTGQKIPNTESLRRERKYLKNGSIWCFQLNRGWAIDGHVGGNDARYINHSCQPNCYTQIIDGTIWVRAAKNIVAGEELTYDYHTNGEGRIHCICKPDCKAML